MLSGRRTGAVGRAFAEAGEDKAVGFGETSLGLLALGKSNFVSLEEFRPDRFIQDALGIWQMPGSVRLRQSLESHAALREHTDPVSVRPIRLSGATDHSR